MIDGEEVVRTEGKARPRPPTMVHCLVTICIMRGHRFPPSPLLSESITIHVMSCHAVQHLHCISCHSLSTLALSRSLNIETHTLNLTEPLLTPQFSYQPCITFTSPIQSQIGKTPLPASPYKHHLIKSSNPCPLSVIVQDIISTLQLKRTFVT